MYSSFNANENFLSSVTLVRWLSYRYSFSREGKNTRLSPSMEGKSLPTMLSFLRKGNRKQNTLLRRKFSSNDSIYKYSYFPSQSSTVSTIYSHRTMSAAEDPSSLTPPHPLPTTNMTSNQQLFQLQSTCSPAASGVLGHSSWGSHFGWFLYAYGCTGFRWWVHVVGTRVGWVGDGGTWGWIVRGKSGWGVVGWGEGYGGRRGWDSSMMFAGCRYEFIGWKWRCSRDEFWGPGSNGIHWVGAWGKGKN